MDDNKNPDQQPLENSNNIPDPTKPVIPASEPGSSTIPLKPASKFSIKAIIGTVIFLLLAGGAAAGYVYREPILKLVSSPTPTPTIALSPTINPDTTENWKTYTNNEEGYFFMYPNTWSVVDSSNNQYEKGSSQIKKNGSMIYATISVSTLNYLCGLECQKMTESDFFDKKNQFYKTGYIGGGGPGITVEKVYENKIGGKRAIISEAHPTNDYSSGGSISKTTDLSTNYYIYLGTPANEILRIILSGYSINDKKALSEFNQILSTFKFEKPDNKFFKIPELDIQFSINEDLADLTYKIKDSGDIKIAYFTSTQLESSEPGCSAVDGGIGAISRYSTSPEQVNKKIGNYYFVISGSQAICSKGDSTLEQKKRKSFLELTESLETLN